MRCTTCCRGSCYPAVRAVEALATTVPLFVLVFASAYFVMARSSPGGFSYQLTRTDSLYFTVTTFNTVGFGDTTATSQTGRFVVTVQMILDLLMLGLGIRVFVGAGRATGATDAAGRRRSGDLANRARQ